ncbi:HAD family hydrolase [Porphyromonas macacae]|uniref:YjjG family noncanonical pyrimidine nucleotidase n=1 Tax=Porphyromonas macacae TaxID=28115 RepID=UPI00052DD7FD|nr:YjjG family noncanonical pyrimidine nucleotidase [Porphyromonas macacae]KGN99453.1 HAD family hydrolase [Porphyromonas macacae]
MIKTLFIDLDDTLWATFENNRESLKEIYTALDWGQYFISFDAFFDVFMPHNEFLWSEYRKGTLDKQELTLERFRYPFRKVRKLADDEILSINELFLNTCSSKKGLCPGAVDVLKYLYKRYSLCILSNGFREVQQRKMDMSGLSPFISNIVLSEDAGVNKPHKGIFDFAFEHTGALPEETLMIGDSWEADIEGAHRAGIPSIWYNPKGAEMPQGEQARPAHIISHLKELKELL